MSDEKEICQICELYYKEQPLKKLVSAKTGEFLSDKDRYVPTICDCVNLSERRQKQILDKLNACQVCGCEIRPDSVGIIGCSNKGCMNYPGNVF